MCIRRCRYAACLCAKTGECYIQKDNDLMLTKKQKKYLAGQAVNLKPLFQVGKDALSDNFIVMIDNALRARELIKIKVLKTAPEDVEEIAFDLAMNTESEVVQRIGRTIVLYRRNPDKQGIILP